MPFINPKKPISAQDIYKVTLEQQAKKERDERREEALKEQSARKHLHEQSAFVEGALKRETVRDKYAKFSESVKTRLIGYAVSEIASSAMKKVNESFGKDIFNNSNVNTMNAITYSFIHENGEGSSIMYNMMKGSPSIYIDSLGKIIKETHHDMIAAVDKDDPFSFSVDQNAMKDYETSVKDIYGHDDIVESIADRVVKQGYVDYVTQFKNKNLRHILESVIGYRYNALSFIYTLGSFASGDCGYPHGGSVQMAKNIADTFLNLGGKIQYRTKVEKVVIENNVTKGVQTKDGFIPGDAVIVTEDARAALDNLFKKPLESAPVKSIKENAIGEQNMFVCLGVKADLIKYPYTSILPLDEPFEYAGLKFNEIRINNYAKYKDHAPEGCTSMTCLLIGDSYDFWKAAKEDGTYKEKKTELAEKLIETISKFIPEIKDNVDAIDVATPCTYERYCGSYGGSWMSVWKAGGKQFNYPVKLDKKIKNLYFAGQRIRMPGGLPLAAYTARLAVQELCKDTKTMFI